MLTEVMKKWIVLVEGTPCLEEGDVLEFDSKPVALEYAHALVNDNSQRAVTVQEWTKTREVEVH